jgi:predicted pyridoxine 5'-phosphate oxidase superfamily flavin-nucleotide-binding protein
MMIEPLIGSRGRSQTLSLDAVAYTSRLQPNAVSCTYYIARLCRIDEGLDGRTLNFADFRGNRQYIGVGNKSVYNRVTVFFVDYPRSRRLEPLARATTKELQADAGLVLGWNCPTTKGGSNAR